MKRFAFALAVGLLIAGPAAAQPAIKGLQLGMSLPDGEVEAIYQTALGAEIEDSVGLTIPYDHIETKLTDGSRLSLHFSSATDGSRLFWIRHSTSWIWPSERQSPDLSELIGSLEQRFGAPAREAGSRDGTSDLLLVFPAADSGPLPQELALAPGDVGGVQFMSFQQRNALLGRDFVGATVTIVMDGGKVVAVVEDLIDHRLGATVLNPGN